ncbi:MAG TPA: hypothetical protein VM243_02865 [Phycisphaerae bacterium]|nr:hypothetical protein [Phycisphaerae bacterium]
MTEAPTPEAAAPRRSTGWAVVGVVLVLLGPIAYGLLLGVPLMRATGAPAFAFMAAGAAAGLVAAWRDRRIWVRGLCVLDVLLLLAFVWVMFGLFALPQAEGVAEITVAPDFTLPDHTGQPVTLSAARASGPVLLVFYRGHW